STNLTRLEVAPTVAGPRTYPAALAARDTDMAQAVNTPMALDSLALPRPSTNVPVAARTGSPVKPATALESMPTHLTPDRWPVVNGTMVLSADGPALPPPVPPSPRKSWKVATLLILTVLLLGGLAAGTYLALPFFQTAFGDDKEPKQVAQRPVK